VIVQTTSSQIFLIIFTSEVLLIVRYHGVAVSQSKLPSIQILLSLLLDSVGKGFFVVIVNVALSLPFFKGTLKVLLSEDTDTVSPSVVLV
jgi:hypothetical protein